jgi:CRP-like cAMP-binding protein
MTSDPRGKWMRSVPIFAGLSDAAIERVLSVATEFDVAPGHVLVQPDEPGAGLFIIEEGSATVELKDRRITLGQGECIGELALLTDGATHTGRVYAATPLRAIAISRNDFDRLLDDEPMIARSLLKVLALRLAQTTRQGVQ